MIKVANIFPVCHFVTSFFFISTFPQVAEAIHLLGWLSGACRVLRKYLGVLHLAKIIYIFKPQDFFSLLVLLEFFFMFKTLIPPAFILRQCEGGEKKKERKFNVIFFLSKWLPCYSRTI